VESTVTSVKPSSIQICADPYFGIWPFYLN